MGYEATGLLGSSRNAHAAAPNDFVFLIVCDGMLCSHGNRAIRTSFCLLHA